MDALAEMVIRIDPISGLQDPVSSIESPLSASTGIGINAAGYLFAGARNRDLGVLLGIDPLTGQQTTVLSGVSTSFRDIAVDAVGRVLVAGFGNGIFRIDPAGGTSTLVTSALSQPWGITIEASGEILVTNDDALVRVDPVTGEFAIVSSGGDFSSPRGIGVFHTLYCDDEVDNDGDGVVDLADPGCSGAADASEVGTGACDDGSDNDGDGRTDLADPDCKDPYDSSEAAPPPPPGCGFGPELLLPLLWLTIRGRAPRRPR
jgi:streptogramin lyase